VRLRRKWTRRTPDAGGYTFEELHKVDKDMAARSRREEVGDVEMENENDLTDFAYTKDILSYDEEDSVPRKRMKMCPYLRRVTTTALLQMNPRRSTVLERKRTRLQSSL